MNRYLITRDWGCIHRVDGETIHFYVTTEDNHRGGTYVSRWKKQHGDVLFDTLSEARAALATVHEARAERAWAIKEEDLHGARSSAFVCVADEIKACGLGVKA